MSLAPSDASVVYAVSEAGIDVSEDGGASWRVATGDIVFPRAQSVAVHPENAASALVGVQGPSGGFYRTDDLGGTWTPANGSLGDDATGRAVAFDPGDPSVIYAGRDNQGIFKSVDGGQSWNPVNDGLVNFSVFRIAIDPQDAQTLYAGTNSGIFKSTDGAAQWNDANQGLESAQDRAVRGIAVDALDGDVLYAATRGGVFKSIDGGASWQRRQAGLAADAYLSVRIDPGNRHRVFAGSELNGVFQSIDFGDTWEALGGAELEALQVVDLGAAGGDPTRVYAAVAGLGVAAIEIDGEVPTPIATATPIPTSTPTMVPIACAGDCNGNGTVTINELILAVGITLGRNDLSACAAVDTSGNGTVTINELIAAVNRSLNGC
jgi:photosystem II stability/assembly factor-like uncharacterized protein